MTIDELTQEQEIDTFFNAKYISDETEQKTYYMLFHLCGETHSGNWRDFKEYLEGREKNGSFSHQVRKNITEDIERIGIILDYERNDKLPTHTQSL